jgi:hypothetical protein
MSSETGRSLFTHYLESAYANENIQFYVAAERLHEVKDMDVFRKQAQEVYDQYVMAGAPMEVRARAHTLLYTAQVNINSEMREEIRVGLQSEKPLSRRLFKPASKHIYHVMEKDCFTRFRQTDSYKQWVASEK